MPARQVRDSTRQGVSLALWFKGLNSERETAFFLKIRLKLLQLVRGV